MLKNNKVKLIISSVLIVLPVLIGIIFWDELPERIVTHWGPDGNADGWSSRAFAVFVLPLFMLAVHWLCVFFTARDPKNRNQNKKVFGLVIWICPVVSIFANGIVYAAAFGKKLNVNIIMMLLMGLMFTAIGNYLPKCKQNRTIGIKVKWALESEENWNATHRMGGKVWVAGGLLMMACVFLPESLIPWALIAIMPILAFVPVIYSYVYYRKHRNQ